MSRSLRAAIPRFTPRANRWYRTERRELQRAPRSMQQWLGWPDSLTERLAQQLQGKVEVRLLSERLDRLLIDEREHLGSVSHTARVREVQLEIRGHAVVVARTVFPDATARVMDHALRKLGTRSLGSLLFGTLRAPVRMREFTCLSADASLRCLLVSHLPAGGQGLWARRALHLLHDRPLLVTEIFLPQLLAMAPDTSSHGSSG